jgi:dihydrofolate reductase
MAHDHAPQVAERMNSAPKVVFSQTMEKATWNNTTLIKGDIVEQIRKMKKESGEGMVIMGSGSIIAQLAPEGVIDEYQVIVNPVVLGAGRTMFEGVKNLIGLKQKTARVFKNGNVYLCYEPES